MVGIANAYAFVWIAQYYTDTKYKPVKQIAEASTTGHATNVIAGISIGLESTALPVLVMSAALISSYWLGNTSGKALALFQCRSLMTTPRLRDMWQSLHQKCHAGRQSFAPPELTVSIAFLLAAGSRLEKTSLGQVNVTQGDYMHTLG